MLEIATKAVDYLGESVRVDAEILSTGMGAHFDGIWWQLAIGCLLITVVGIALTLLQEYVIQRQVTLDDKAETSNVIPFTYRVGTAAIPELPADVAEYTPPTSPFPTKRIRWQTSYLNRTPRRPRTMI